MGTAIISFGQAGGSATNAKLALRGRAPDVTEPLTTSGTSAATTATASSHCLAAIYPSVAGYAVAGASPTASSTTGWYCPADMFTEIAVNYGDKIAFIEA